MNSFTVIFYIFGALATLSATGILVTRSVFYALLFLIICLCSVAGIYVLAFAEYLAVTQILLYAGGIVVLLLFGLMLTSAFAGKPLQVKSHYWFAGFLAAGSLFMMLIYFFPKHTTTPIVPNVTDTVTQTGIGLLTTHSLPFEIAGVLLLVTLLGATVVATSIPSKKRS